MEILEGSPKYRASHYVEWLITVVVLVNCSAVILDSIPEVHVQQQPAEVAARLAVARDTNLRSSRK